MPNRLVVAEKRSVARALYRVLRREGEMAEVISVSGHLMDSDLSEKYSKWRLTDLLELLQPSNTRLVISDEKSFERLIEAFRRIKGGQLIVATDNDHEGELIGYELLLVYRKVCGDSAEYRRMRFNSLEEEELIRAWRRLEPELNWGWVYKAQLRRSFDLLTGAAFTRLLTLSARRRGEGSGVISWGPVQSPCLNFIVAREQRIREFRPTKYWYIVCVLKHGSGVLRARTDEVWDSFEAARLFEAASSAKSGVVQSYREERAVVARPLPARTDDSLRDLVRITGQSSQSLMRVMESLYQSGYLSYPRTETNRYPNGFDFERRLRAIAGSPILWGVGLSSEARPRNGRLNDGAHPPIYPTRLYKGSGVAGAVWEYFARRFLANAYMGDAILVRQSAIILAGGVAFKAFGRYLEEPGFYVVYPYFKPEEDALPRLSPGEFLEILELRLVEDETRPPDRLSEAELLKLMEDNELGTDATRPLYPSLLLERGYIERSKRRLRPTPLGEALIDTLKRVDERLVTPETRRIVEAFMRSVERGEMTVELALEQALEVYRPLLQKCLTQVELIGELLASHGRPAHMS